MFKTLCFLNHFQNSPTKLWRVLGSPPRAVPEAMFSLEGIHRKQSRKHLFLRQVLGGEKKISSKECFICRQDRDILQKLKMSKYSFRTGRNFTSLAFSPLNEKNNKKSGIICHMTLCYDVEQVCAISFHMSGQVAGRVGRSPECPHTCSLQEPVCRHTSCFQTAFLDSSGSISFVPS